jgi:hypothetical protein
MALEYSEYEKTEKALDIESSYSHSTDLRDPYFPAVSAVPSNGVGMSSQEQKSLARRNSVSMTRGPVKVNPKVKIPGEFRTLRSV